MSFHDNRPGGPEDEQSDRNAWNAEYRDPLPADRAEDPVPGPPQPATMSELLDEAIQHVAEARPAPMSSMAKVDRDELLDLLEDVRDLLPEEIRAARWLLKERDQFLADARRERDAIIGQARVEVARLVDRQAVVHAGEDKARRIVTEAREDARRTRNQLDDYCERKLSNFERVLDETTSAVREGRQKLSASIDLTGLEQPDDASFEAMTLQTGTNRADESSIGSDQQLGESS